MALETGVTYIEDLVATNPNEADNDTLDESDNHHRIIKTAVQGSFPSLGAAAVTATAAELSQVASNTFGGSTSGDVVTIDDTQTLTNKTLTSPTVNGQNGYGLVMLDAPEDLGTITYGAWTTLDMSTAYAQAATDNAVIAIVKVKCMATEGGGTGNADSYCNLRVVGSAEGAGTTETNATLAAWASSDINNEALNFSTAHINLDASSDFQYYAVRKSTYSTALNYVRLFLVGYYV